jgi:hypothetical protein
MIMSRISISRIFIAIVLFFNLECALSFIISPQTFSTSFELMGEAGEIAVIGTGLLFIMWNIPYIFALIHPIKNKISLVEAVVMQGIGFLGESILYIQIGGQHAILKSSILRFMIFDGFGFLLLGAALRIIIGSVHLEKSPVD